MGHVGQVGIHSVRWRPAIGEIAPERLSTADRLCNVPKMFYSATMQTSFSFGAGDLADWRARLSAVDPVTLPAKRRRPIGQMIKSLISGRTRDAVSLAAYRRLAERFGSTAGIAAADPAVVERAIGDVSFADAKAVHLVAALRRIGREQPDFDLAFLGEMPVDTALAWLERLPGVARKVAASTLNASTLDRPVLIVDGHVLRVLTRLAFVPVGADYRVASEAATAAMTRWSGEDFLAFHILTKRLGQTLCRPVLPTCGRCPLRRDCPGAGQG